MRRWWILAALLSPLLLEAQTGCNHTDLGNGVVCIASANASSMNTQSVTVSNFNAVGANLIVVNVQAAPTARCTPSTNLGAAFLGLPRQVAPSVFGNEMFYAVNPPVSATMSFNCDTGNSAYPAMQVAAFSGIDTTTNPLDQQAGTPDATLPTVTPTSANQLMIVGAAVGDPLMLTINSGFTIRELSPGVSGFAYAGALAMRTMATPMPVTVSWTQAFVTTLATFRAVNVIPPPDGNHGRVIGGGIL